MNALCSNGQEFTREERAYLREQPPGRRDAIMREIKELCNANITPLRFQVLESTLPNKPDILARLRNDPSPKYEAWVRAALALPLQRVAAAPIHGLGCISGWLRDTRREMDAKIWGQHRAKDEVVRMLCQWANAGATGTFGILLCGLPGIGKTHFATKVLGKAMKRPFTSISLAGVQDSNYLLGHSYTYEGAMCGRIADAMKSWGVKNGILYFDEVDKAKGQDVTNVLINLTDREQNHHFRDKYFSGIDLDFSSAIVVASCNDDALISPVLRNRLIKIEFEPPSRDDKVAIAREHLVPRALRRANMKTGDLTFNDAALRCIAERCGDEAGMRGMDQIIERIVNTMSVVVSGSADQLRCVDLSRIGCKLPIEISSEIVYTVLAGETSRSNESSLLMYC